MKMIKKSLMLVVMMFVVTNVTSVSAQVSTKEVLRSVLVVVASIEDDDNQILFIQIDNLSRGSTDSQTYTLAGGSRYGIVAIGDDDRIQDIDLKVYDEDGDLVGKDTDDKNIAMVEVRPGRQQRYKISVSAYEMSYNSGFYGIVIFRKD